MTLIFIDVFSNCPPKKKNQIVESVEYKTRKIRPKEKGKRKEKGGIPQ